MSGVEALATPETTTAEPVAMDFDKDMGDVWDRMVTQNGSDRADDGRFTSPNNDDAVDDTSSAPETVESALEGADKGDGADAAASTPEVSVPLPPNWRGKEQLWEKVPADIRAQLAEFQNEQHNTLSEQGRQLAASKPLTDAVNEFRHLFEGRIDPAEGIRRLAQAQQGLENPGTRLQTIMSLVDGYGAREQLAAILTGKAAMPAAQVSQPQPDIDKIVSSKVAETLDLQNRERAVADFANANPLWVQVPQDQQINYTQAARMLLPTASNDAVLKKALAMAIEDTPALKAQVAAAATKPPIATKQPSPEAVRRANSVNVPSTSTGKVREPSLEETLGGIWEKHHRG